MFSVKHSAKIGLVYLIPLWQPSLKHNQLVRVICCQRAEDLQLGCPRGSWKPLPGSAKPTQIQCDIRFDTNLKKTCTTISAALLTSDMLFCVKGADYQDTKLHLSVWQGHMESDSLTHNLCGSAAPCGEEFEIDSICSGWWLAVSMKLVVFGERKKSHLCRSVLISETGNRPSYIDIELWTQDADHVWH